MDQRNASSNFSSSVATALTIAGSQREGRLLLKDRLVTLPCIILLKRSNTLMCRTQRINNHSYKARGVEMGELVSSTQFSVHSPGFRPPLPALSLGPVRVETRRLDSRPLPQTRPDDHMDQKNRW